MYGISEFASQSCLFCNIFISTFTSISENRHRHHELCLIAGTMHQPLGFVHSDYQFSLYHCMQNLSNSPAPLKYTKNITSKTDESRKLNLRYALWIDFFHCYFLNSTLSHIVCEHCMEVRYCSSQYNSMRRKRLILNLKLQFQMFDKKNKQTNKFKKKLNQDPLYIMNRSTGNVWLILYLQGNIA